MEVIYKNFEIKPDPKQKQESGGWQADVLIINNKTSGIKMKLFPSSKTYKSQEEANKQSIVFGEEIIDGRHQGLSVSDI